MTCDRHWPGWYCIRKQNHIGPCALKPQWWNLRARWKMRNRSLRWSD